MASIPEKLSDKDQKVSVYNAEFLDPDTGSYYSVVIKDFDEKNKQVLIGFEREWKPDAFVSIESVRPAPQPWDQNYAYRENESVDVKAKGGENEPYSWWPAIIQRIQDRFHLVQYKHFPTNTDMLEKDMLRPMNQAKPLRSQDLKRVVLQIPQELRGSIRSEDFDLIRKSSSAFSITLDLANNTLIAITSPLTSLRAQNLIEARLAHICELRKLQSRTTELRHNVSALEHKLEKGYKEVFTVAPDLISMTIGKKGNNIKRATIEGVEHVRVDPSTNTVTILACDKETALRCRRLLEIVKDQVTIPANVIGRVVGKGFSFMHEIEDKVGGVHISLEREDDSYIRPLPPNDPWPEEGEKYQTADVVISGTADPVSDAKILLEQHIEFLKQSSHLTKEEQYMQEKLKNLSKEAGRDRERQEPRDRDRNFSHRNQRRHDLDRIESDNDRRNFGDQRRTNRNQEQNKSFAENKERQQEGEDRQWQQRRRRRMVSEDDDNEDESSEGENDRNNRSHNRPQRAHHQQQNRQPQHKQQHQRQEQPIAKQNQQQQRQNINSQQQSQNSRQGEQQQKRHYQPKKKDDQ